MTSIPMIESEYYLDKSFSDIEQGSVSINSLLLLLWEEGGNVFIHKY